MALAQLREVDGDGDSIRIELDTGTSPFFRVLLGTGVRTVDDVVVLDEPYWASPWQRNARAGRHLDTGTVIRIPRAKVSERRSLVQVQSAKDAEGRAPAFSTPVRVDTGGEVPLLGSAPGEVPAMTLSLPAVAPSKAVRTAIPHATAAARFSRTASLDDLLGSLVEVAGPLLQGLLAGDSGGGAAGPGTASGGSGISTDALGELLRTVLAAAGQAPASPGAPTTPAAAPHAPAGAVPPSPATPTVPAPTAPPAAVSAPPAHAGAAGPGASVGGGAVGGGTAAGVSSAGSHQAAPAPAADLFGSAFDPLPAGGDLFSTPESARVDWTSAARPLWRSGDPLIHLTDTLVGVLPRLLNTIADRHTRGRGDARVRMEDVLTAQARARLVRLLAQGDGSDPAVHDLTRLLRTGTAPAPVGTPASAQGDPAPARTQSMAETSTIASRAVLTPLLAPPVARPLGPRSVFATAQAVTLRFQLDVGEGGPTTALPRAILDVDVREPGAATALVSRSERLTGVRPGTPLSVALTAQDVAALPHEVDLEVAATLRWRGRSGVYRAGCANRIVIAAQRSISATGASAGETRELTDMARYRSFWNRVWSTTDADDGDLPLWGFDAAVRYSVVVTGEGRGNGLMQTRADVTPAEGGIRSLTAGRFKAGIELDVNELNGLLPLWAATPLTPAAVEAFAAQSWRAGQGGDATVNVRFEGRRNTRGALWVVPVLGLRAFTLTSATELDPFGQVLAVSEEEVRFPVVESVRVLGLSSTIDEDSPEPSDSGYAFDGYTVAFDVKAGLEPATGGG